MATTYVDNGGAVNGSNKEYTFSFPYLKTEDIQVALNGITQATTKYTVSTSPTKITFNNTNVDATLQESDGAPKTGVIVRVYRDTDVDAAKAVYAAGSSIRAVDLNDNQDQVLYALQEEQNQLERLTNADINPAAEIEVSKLKDGTARQVLQTDAAGTGVEWTSNIDISGTAKLATVDINGGAIDGTTIGATSETTGAFTTISASGNLSIGGTVDGRNVSADGTKLDGIESGATADQTAAEIRAAVSDASDSNVFTDADHTKLDGIATGAEVNVQSDWNASSGDAQILNKPSLTSALNDLTDVSTAGVGNGKILKYVAANSRWEVAEDAIGAGGVPLTDGDKGDITVGSSGGTWTIDDNTIGTDELNTTSGTADSSTFLRGDMTWAAAGSSLTIKDEGTDKTTAATSINFVGSGVEAANTGTDVTVTVSGGGGNTSTDFKYLALRNAANNGAASYPASDFTLVTSGTTTALTPAQANALIVSYGGVIQQPNTGTGTPTTGFAISGSTIKFGSAIAAAPDFIIYLQGAGVASIANNTVTLEKLEDGTSSNNGKFLRANNGADPTWETVSSTPEGTAILSTGVTGTTKFLRVNGDNSCSWQVPPDTDTDSFVGLTDTPANFTSAGGKFIAVNSGATALEYVTAPAGSVADGCIYENDQTISNNHTIAAGKGAHSVGPITVNATVTVNGNWVVS